MHRPNENSGELRSTPRWTLPSRARAGRVCAAACLVASVLILGLSPFSRLALAQDEVQTEAQEELTGLAVMTMVRDQAQQYPQETSDVKLQILDAQGKVRTRYFTLKSLRDARLRNSLIKFYAPNAVKGTGLLTQTRVDNPEPADAAPADEASTSSAPPPPPPTTEEPDDDVSQFVYFPAFRSIRQLSVGERNGSFVGSDFSYADIAGRRLEDDTHELVETSEKFWFIRSTPRRADDSYTRLDLVVERRTLVIRQVVFYDASGEKLKTLTNKTVRKIDGVWTITEAEMVNHLGNSRTLLSKESVDYQKALSPSDVGLPGLKSGA